MTSRRKHRFTASLRYALRGLSLAWQSEPNFRIECAFGAAVLLVALLLPLERWEMITVILVTSLVLGLELLNTLIEHFTNLLEPRIHSYVRHVKDLMSALVLIAAISAAVVGLLIFVPHFTSLFSTF